jgi:hypothetical protein
VKVPPPVPHSIKDWGFNALALTFFVVGVYSLLWIQPFRNATAALIAAAFCALMGNRDRFQVKFSLVTGYRSRGPQNDPASRDEQAAVSEAFGDGNESRLPGCDVARLSSK